MKMSVSTELCDQEVLSDRPTARHYCGLSRGKKGPNCI